MTAPTSRPGRLVGHAAIVTGASRGIGLAIAAALATEGADVCLMATDARRLAAAREELAGLPGRRLEIALDVTDREACRGAVARVLAEFGRLDVLVNNAGIHIARSFLDHDPADFQRLLDVNLFGVIHMTQAVLPAMLERGYGRIVNLASTAGRWGSRNQSGYNISKHAVLGLTRCVALETAARGVTVNAICPGFVDTDMLEGIRRDYGRMGIDADAAIGSMLAHRVPLGRALRVDELTGMAVHLASPESSAMTGQALTIDGGMLTA
jgi:NAD(P)-dependent dehydrogenase (short-subunit alcohol dehydrogenase family)